METQQFKKVQIDFMPNEVFPAVVFVGSREQAISLIAEGWACIMLPQMFNLKEGYYGLQHTGKKVDDPQKELEMLETRFRLSFDLNTHLE